MSFYKEYKNRKDWRKKSYKSKAVAGSCRNHGDCPVCYSNRHHKYERQKPFQEEYHD